MPAELHRGYAYLEDTEDMLIWMIELNSDFTEFTACNSLLPDKNFSDDMQG